MQDNWEADIEIKINSVYNPRYDSIAHTPHMHEAYAYSYIEIYDTSHLIGSFITVKLSSLEEMSFKCFLDNRNFSTTGSGKYLQCSIRRHMNT